MRTDRLFRHALFLPSMAAVWCMAGPIPMAFGQCGITSTTGYTVNALVYPIALVPSSDNCPWGYNYNVRLAYDISFDGPGAPGSMWPLHGTVTCGSQTHFFNLPNGGGSGEVTSQSNQWRGVPDCNTADIHSLSCYAVDLQISGPGISYRAADRAFSPLPVALLDLQAVAGSVSVRLQWRTGSEHNSERFVVESSSDGYDPVPVLSVPAAGESLAPRLYEALAPDPLPGTSNYPLRTVDQDGSEALSTWSVADVRSHTERQSVFPNPNAGNVLHTAHAAPGSALVLYDATGTLVYEGVLRDDRVHLPGLPPGHYLGHIRTPEGENEPFRYVQQ